MKKLLLVALMSMIGLSSLAGCTRIESGHVGIQTNWNKTIEPGELNPGTHSSVFVDITEVVANEINMPIDNLTPQTKDKTILNDIDLNLVYTVNPSNISDLYVRYKNRHAFIDGQVYPMYLYLDTVARSAVSDAVGEYDALDANSHRKDIENKIQLAVVSKLKEEGIDGMIKINQVIVKNLKISPELQRSSETVITAQNELKAKSFQVDTARKEAERMQLLASQSGPQYIEFMKAQANLIQAQGLADAVKSGHVPNWVVMPVDSKMIISSK